MTLSLGSVRLSPLPRCTFLIGYVLDGMAINGRNMSFGWYWIVYCSILSEFVRRKLKGCLFFFFFWKYNSTVHRHCPNHEGQPIIHW